MGWDRAPTNGVAHRVPERDLIAGLQVAFENEELEIAAGLTEMDALMGARVEAPAGGRAALAWWQVARRTVGVHRGGETGRAAPEVEQEVSCENGSVKKQSWQDWVQFIGVLAALLLRCNAIFRSQCIFDVFWAQRCTGQGGEFQYCAQQQPSPAIALLHEALLIVAMVRWFAANGSELRPDVAALAIWVVAYCRSDGC